MMTTIRSVLLLLVGASSGLLGSCGLPDLDANPSAERGFRCFASDEPPCPQGLTCCAGSLCGDDLLARRPYLEGWCVSRIPSDQVASPDLLWSLPAPDKPAVEPLMDPMLTGYDRSMTWRCPRNDEQPGAPGRAEVYLEPNDSLKDALRFGILTPSIPQKVQGMAEICPNRSSPLTPDIDVFAFQLDRAVHLIMDVRFQSAFGDLDIGLFRDDVDALGNRAPTLVAADVASADDACIVKNDLEPGNYFAVVRGARALAGPKTGGVPFALNRYSIRLFTQEPGSSQGCN